MRNAATLGAIALGALLNTCSPGHAKGNDAQRQDPDAVQAMPRAALEKETQMLRAQVKTLLERLETTQGKKVLEDGCPVDCRGDRWCGNGLTVIE
ncbi:hypothetical protein HZA43_05510 [Candidatus Peregrinibacteria bacterium]|nr:hypothetical protein [Candidatus Peregrinibacteria bacterium]